MASKDLRGRRPKDHWELLKVVVVLRFVRRRVSMWGLHLGLKGEIAPEQSSLRQELHIRTDQARWVWRGKGLCSVLPEKRRRTLGGFGHALNSP